jgi:hypothetical protein
MRYCLRYSYSSEQTDIIRTKNTRISCQSRFYQPHIFTYPLFYVCNVSIRGITTLCVYRLKLIQSLDSAVGIATGWTTEGSEFESR